MLCSVPYKRSSLQVIPHAPYPWKVTSKESKLAQNVVQTQTLTKAVMSLRLLKKQIIINGSKGTPYNGVLCTGKCHSI
jgi:hypothetical protein